MKHSHNWEEFAPYKRRCGCGKEEWVFQNPYPGMGEAAYTWEDMSLPPLLPLRRFMGWSDVWRGDGTGTRDFYFLFIRLWRHRFVHSTWMASDT